jgi:hypothetical protein
MYASYVAGNSGVAVPVNRKWLLPSPPIHDIFDITPQEKDEKGKSCDLGDRVVRPPLLERRILGNISLNAS